MEHLTIFGISYRMELMEIKNFAWTNSCDNFKV
jgi:hypothetical protein